MDGGSDAMAGFTHKISDNLTFTYMFMIGNFGFRSNGEFGYEQCDELAQPNSLHRRYLEARERLYPDAK